MRRCSLSLSLSLRGVDFPSGSSVLPSDKEVEMLEGLNFDETDKLRLFVFNEPLVCFRPY